MYSSSRVLTFLTLCTLLLMAGCGTNTPTEKPPPTKQTPTSEGSIKFIAQGGIGGGIRKNLTINLDGLAVNHTVTPTLHKQLSEEKQQHILSLFNEFFSMPKEFERTICSDDINYTVTYQTKKRKKSVSASGCTLSDAKHDTSKLYKYAAIVGSLVTLSRHILKQAPWHGLKVTFSTDQKQYKVGEPITFQYHISNPTNQQRTLYFPYKNRYWILINSKARQKQAYIHPENYYNHPLQKNPAGLDSLIFEPGQKRTFEYKWDQAEGPDSLSTGGSHQQKLLPGIYFVSMGLLASGGYGASYGHIINIIDHSGPLTGHIIVDSLHKSQNSSTYTFKLLLRNRSEHNATLNFPKRERLHVTLYANQNYQIFSSVEKEAPYYSTITLQPGDSVIIKRPFSKKYLHLSSGKKVLVRVKLLANDIHFVRQRTTYIKPYKQTH